MDEVLEGIANNAEQSDREHEKRAIKGLQEWRDNHGPFRGAFRPELRELFEQIGMVLRNIE